MTYLYLEYVRKSSTWPWRNLVFTALVLSELAELHNTLGSSTVLESLPWAYDVSLQVAAQATLETFELVTA